MSIQIPFLVADQPFVVQLPDSEGEDHRFYDSLHPSMPAVWVLSAMREYEDPLDVGERALTTLTPEGVRHVVGLRNRGLYLQLLEGLFAHLFANAQFPIAPQAWLTRYRPVDLRTLAKCVRRTPWESPSTVPVLSHPDEFVSWLFGIEQMGALSADDRAKEVLAVQRVLGLLATDYSSAGLDQEYNSSKHGLRAMPAPWSLTISPTDQPDLRVAMGATHGSHFLVDERGAGGARHYFTLRRRSQSWHPERDLKLSQLCSWLLHNLISARRSPAPRRQFYVFRNIDLDDLGRLIQQVVHFEMGTPLDLPDPVPSRGEITPGAQAIAADVATWVLARASEVAEGRATRSDAPPPADTTVE